MVYLAGKKRKRCRLSFNVRYDIVDVEVINLFRFLTYRIVVQLPVVTLYFCSIRSRIAAVPSLILLKEVGNVKR